MQRAVNKNLSHELPFAWSNDERLVTRLKHLNRRMRQEAHQHWCLSAVVRQNRTTGTTCCAPPPPFLLSLTLRDSVFGTHDSGV